MTTENSLGQSLSIKKPEGPRLSTRAKVTNALMVAFLGLTACSPQEISSTVIPDNGGHTTSSMPVEPTDIPTETMAPTETPTPTETPGINEHDSESAYTENISEKFMEVSINTDIITSRSLDPKITKVEINDSYKNSKGENSEQALTHFSALIFFTGWWYDGPTKHETPPTDEDFTGFMELWAKAQKGEIPWSDIQFKLRANDFNDGNGYVPKDFEIWPMYNGTSPDGIRAINNFSIVFADKDRVQNIELPDNEYFRGYGLNIDGTTLYAYIGIYEGGPVDTTSWSLLRALSLLPSFIHRGRVSGLEDTKIMKLLATEVVSNAYRSSIKVYESGGNRNRYEQQYNP